MRKYLVDVHFEEELLLFAWPVNALSPETATEKAVDAALTLPYFFSDDPPLSTSLSVTVFIQDLVDAGRWVSTRDVQQYKRIVKSPKGYFTDSLCFHSTWPFPAASFTCPVCYRSSTLPGPFHYSTCPLAPQESAPCTLHFGPLLAGQLIEGGRAHSEDLPLYANGNLNARVFKALFPLEALALSAK